MKYIKKYQKPATTITRNNLPEVVVTAKRKPVKEFLNKYTKRLNEEIGTTTDFNPLSFLMSPVSAALSFPQAAATFALSSGKHTLPSEALNVQEGKQWDTGTKLGNNIVNAPWRSMATNVALDPINLLGVGKLAGTGLKQGVKAVGTEVLDRARPYLVGEKRIPMTGYKPKFNFIENGVENGSDLLYPSQMIDQIKSGKQMGASFFEHPVVQKAHLDNQAVAKRLGINLQMRPNNISEIVNSPINLKITELDKNVFGEFRSAGLGDPSEQLSIANVPMTPSQLKNTVIHESLHRGRYGQPIRPYEVMSKEMYNNEYIPSYNYYKHKVNRIVKPEYQEGYLGDIHGGEAAVNLIELGRETGLKLGQTYPGSKEVLNILNKYNGNKSFLIKQLDMSNTPKIKKVWDAMTGKYFVVPAAIGVGSLLYNQQGNTEQ